MSGTLLLARRYLGYYKGRSALLVGCIALTLFLPITVQLVARYASEALMRRADSTPMVIGAKGSRYDLVLSSLYFRGTVAETVPQAESERIHSSQLGTAVPVFWRYTAKTYPIVGTSLDYFRMRRLELASGTLPQLLGDVVLGAGVAAKLGLKPGDKLLSDYHRLYDISTSYPLRMHVTGVLAESHSPDDWATFCDVKTAHVIDGLCHGHMKVDADVDPQQLLDKDGKHVKLNASVVKFYEITADNIDSFHFHGDPGTFPLTAVIVWPRDAKSATLLKGRYAVSESAQLLVPATVTQELLGFVFEIKRLFDANTLLVGVATLLFLGLVVLLSLRIRARERLTLSRIGCSRSTVFWLQATELALLVGCGVLVAAAASAGLYYYVVTSHVLI